MESGFAEKLKDCESKAPELQAKETEDEGEIKKDNGRLNKSKGVKNADDIVGILEGFGSLSYQSDVSAAAETIADPGKAAQAAEVQQASNEPVKVTPESVINAQNDSSGQIAWMLQTNNAGAQPAQTQDELLKTIGEYLDSLENTSKISSETETGTQTDIAAINSEIISSAHGNTESNLTDPLSAALTTAGPEKETPVTETPGKSEAANITLTESITAETVLPEENPKPLKAKSGEAIEKAAVKGAETTDPEKLKQAVSGQAANANTAVDGRSEKSENGKQEDPHSAASKTIHHEARTQSGSEKSPSNGVAGPQASNPELSTVAHPVFETGQSGSQKNAIHLKDNIIRIVDTVKTGASEGKYDFDIQLKPDFLGKVNIRLSMRDSDLKVQIKTDDLAVKGMLSDQTSSLLNMFREKGINVTHIDISYENNGMQNSGNQMPGQQSGGYNTGGNLYYEPAAEEEPYNTAQAQYASYPRGSSVEFYA